MLLFVITSELNSSSLEYGHEQDFFSLSPLTRALLEWFPK